ncbi:MULTISPECIES: hypothetical protein [unclassified Limnothrix]|uniref:hypothetical protein n=1 Tax=unclassified Limnothrix TaxID=2632864 RepID=UPI001304617E|nr:MULTISPECIES: hypothetical protein [unclassified Limnothrix]MBD2161093.1 hypothetical protein [Limnothrix sp. FACHB-1083]MBD2192544.1 hypothetical protein [Limnothrix sp. FACHB-1088]
MDQGHNPIARKGRSQPTGDRAVSAYHLKGSGGGICEQRHLPNLPTAISPSF